MAKKKLTEELTGSQTISYSFGQGTLSKASYAQTGTYAQLRAVRKDPTVSLARGLLISCIQAGSWNIEADEDVSDDIREFIEHILPLRDSFLYNCIALGRVDFGWVGFEKLFTTDGKRIKLDGLKPLLHDMTTILVTGNGKFNGFRQNPLSGTPTDVPLEKSFHIAFDVEAGNLYGYPLLENVRAAMDMWTEGNDGARRYDKKIAGTHWVIKYPPGTGTVDGVSKDNGEIAALLLAALESSGSIAIPTTTATVLQEMINAEVGDLYAWHVDLLEDAGGKQIDFISRLKYLDTLKVRGLLLPERAILEGQFGTKAEAGEHGDMMIINMEQIDKAIVSMVNEQVINQLVELNFGPDMVGKIWLVALPLIDSQISFLRKLYEKLNDKDLDVETLRNKLDLPTKEGGNEIPEPEVNIDGVPGTNPVEEGAE